MKFDPFLSKAAHLAKMRNYEGALRILKAEEDRYYNSFNYCYLYAVICLHSGGFMEALDYFRRARQIKMKDPSTLLGLAVLYLKRMNTVQAVDYYLDVQESDPKNRIAKRALAVIRKHSDADALSEWLASEKLKKLYPPIPVTALTIKKMAMYVVLLAVFFFAVIGLLSKLGVIGGPVKNSSSRPSADFVLSDEDKSAPVETGGTYKYILTRSEATGLYNKALSLFTSFRDEEAKKNLNRIFESNASEGLKKRARLLFDEASKVPPGFDNFKKGDNVTYAEVVKELAIYRDVYVIWKGMATNIEVTDDYTTFDFLVGYDTRTTLEGIVPVVFDKPVALNNERPLEILGKIEPTNSVSGFRLFGAAIHQSGKLENQ